MSKEAVLEHSPYGWIIRWKGGGAVPGVFKGYFTTKSVAEQTIETYLANRKPKRGASKDVDRKE